MNAKTTVFVLVLVLVLVVIGVNPRTWELFKPNLDTSKPAKVILVAELKPLQQEETITVKFSYSQGVKTVEAANPTIQLSKAKPRAEVAVDLPGTGTYTYALDCRTVLLVNAALVQGTGQGSGTLHIKGDTRLEYNVDTSRSQVRPDAQGRPTPPYQAFLQPPGGHRGPGSFEDAGKKGPAK